MNSKETVYLLDASAVISVEFRCKGRGFDALERHSVHIPWGSISEYWPSGEDRDYKKRAKMIKHPEVHRAEDYILRNPEASERFLKRKEELRRRIGTARGDKNQGEAYALALAEYVKGTVRPIFVSDDKRALKVAEEIGIEALSVEEFMSQVNLRCKQRL